MNSPVHITSVLLTVMMLCMIHNAVSNNCTLEATNDVQKIFNDVLSKDHFQYVYLNLNFRGIEFNSTEFAFLTSTDDVINPLSWVLAIGGRGDLLLGCPFDFRYVSLGTLSASGVTTADIDIIDSSKCFDGSDSSDEDKLNAIVDLFSRLVIDAAFYSNNASIDNTIDLRTVKICLEKQSNETRYIFRNEKTPKKLIARLTTSFHEVLQSTPEFHCWCPKECPDDVTSQPDIIPRVISAPVFDAIISTIVIIIVLFIPHLFFQFFKWENPPKNNDEGKMVIRIDTRPFPFGFAHCVFYSTYCGSPCTHGKCSFWCWFRYLLFSGFMCAICCIQFIPLSYIDDENYELRKKAVERREVWAFDHWTNNYLTFWAVAMILFSIVAFHILNVCLTGYVHIAPSDSGDMVEGDLNRADDIGRSYFNRILFPLEEDKEIVRRICPDHRVNAFEDTPFFWKIWKVLSRLWSGKERGGFNKLWLSAFILINWIVDIVPLIYYTTIVFAILAAVLHRSFSCCNIDDEHAIGVKRPRHEYSHVLLLLISLTFGFGFVFFFVTVPVFCELFIACTRIVEIMGYTVIGLIVNAQYVLPWIVYGLGIVTFFVRLVTTYSSAYGELFYEMFEVVEYLDSNLKYHPVKRDVDGVPQIEIKFFEKIVYKIMPWKPALFFVWIKVVSVSSFFVVGIVILAYADGLGDLTGQSDLLGAVFLGSIPTLLSILTSSSETVLCRNKAKKCKLEKSIKETASNFSKSQREMSVDPEIDVPSVSGIINSQFDGIDDSNV